jgi:hypothetical protein
MTTNLPATPALLCVECGGERFIPLTFPRIRGAPPQRDRVFHPSAKCVTCGLYYFGARAGHVTLRGSAVRHETGVPAAV